MRRPGAGDSAAADPDPIAAETPTEVVATEEDARIDRLERLGALREKGILSDAEFAAEKSRLLGGGPTPAAPSAAAPGVPTEPPPRPRTGRPGMRRFRKR